MRIRNITLRNFYISKLEAELHSRVNFIIILAAVFMSEDLLAHGLEQKAAVVRIG
jgi:hypothetical protein